ncbi:MAG: hypothetical protein CME68_11780 [Halobacteriovoraceae bacterium]|nr:hypothetical protein [Halobacteriovoraceae bacterium]
MVNTAIHENRGNKNPFLNKGRAPKSALSFSDYISEELLKNLKKEMIEVKGIPELYIKPLNSKNSPLEEERALHFVCRLYDEVKEGLEDILKKRKEDRHFIDSQTLKLSKKNKESKLSYLDRQYETVIGKKDPQENIVVGSLEETVDTTIAELPPHLKGHHVTLFGPSDTPKMSINAMNSWHRKRKDEHELVTKLVNESKILPMWGADDEDSKTPNIDSFSEACKNLIKCFDKNLKFQDIKNGKSYSIENEKLAKPIKRPPGFGLPSGGHIYKGNPLPLHLFDFGMHLFHCWNNPEALTFYFPKLENEKEARYLKKLIKVAEGMIKGIQPSYKLGTVRVLVVFENPRAIFRVKEIINELYPYFAGGSLGWHDYLASTARLFRLDPLYRIPVKADPNIVIKYIKASHDLVGKEVGEKGGAAIGGMYGVLPEQDNKESYRLAMIGFIKDILIQLRRGLNGFWVAHPDFVRPGIALCWAWSKFKKENKERDLKNLINALVPSTAEDQKDLWKFVTEQNQESLNEDDPLFSRGLLAATIQKSSTIQNNDPEEVRYNIYQALQYLVGWLNGNGCVALPATLKRRDGKEVFVRVMDDLATTERSRWEVWAEIFHKRFSKIDFYKTLREEIEFIRYNQETETKKIQVKWTEKTHKWYLIGIKILTKLMTDPDPKEFATELLLPFTFDFIRNEKDPWAKAYTSDPKKYSLPKEMTLLEKKLNLTINH